MSGLVTGHRCPGCGSRRVERRGLHGWVERRVLPRLGRHAYRCLECDRRFWDRPRRRQENAPPVAIVAPDETALERLSRRRHPRWRVDGSLETTPYSRTRAYALIGLAWIGLLLLFFALRALWPAAETLVRAID
ncbi:MAG: hypothetical protein AUH72_19730 [Acidobacteria bacterium 13_1_40CM_4_65_8]|nr:MAG: hypothetical protein AUH72_19730 [Acidobacteria bacterium 13_1_40CM_4_65_8]